MPSLARIYSPAHSLPLSSLFAASFSHLVRSPTDTLSAALLPLALLQSAYLVTCLPPAGTSASSSAAPSGPTSDAKERKRHAHGHTAFPLARRITTLLLAAHMSILAGAPLVYVHGMDGAKWAQILGTAMAWDGVFGGSLGVLVGAWFGAVPVPLDWDRAWQAYPITIIAGAYIGYAAFSLLGRCPGIRGKKIRFDDEKPEEKTA
ncbi:hypothetical protein KEM56_000870 [Ascosphaera pollenicola]|nr:hypothetical protein KEM56_000870 [Ascosphaera pollenicola]